MLSAKNNARLSAIDMSAGLLKGTGPLIVNFFDIKSVNCFLASMKEAKKLIGA